MAVETTQSGASAPAGQDGNAGGSAAPAGGAPASSTTTPATSASGAGGAAAGTGETGGTGGASSSSSILGGDGAVGGGDQATTGEQGQTSGETAAGAELEITLPEGVKVDQAMLDGFKPVAKELGLDSAGASKLVGWYAQQQQALEAQGKEAMAQATKAWEAELRADPKVGGQQFPATVAAARAGLNRMGEEALGPGGGKQLGALLDELGLGSHPMLVKAWAAVGKAFAEDNPSAGAPHGAATDQKAWLKQMFDHPTSRQAVEE